MTPFDEYTIDHSLQMTKLLIPFLPPNTQRPMAILIKFMEFRNTVASFRSMTQSVSTSDDIFHSLKSFMNASDLESFDQMMSMMNMMSMMQEMQEESEKEGESTDGLDESS